ncbi:MAG: enoyl-CoA hydratase/isomerase family protein [Bdellovibrionales bacterium]|nr:enoyl-CoA hydratase/isomerase family protein [Bdellovibrionales bacterium]
MSTSGEGISLGQAFTLIEAKKTGSEAILFLRFDLKGEKVNKFSRAVMVEFDETLKKLQSMATDGKVAALILVSGKPGNFIAGADIELINSAKTAAEAEDLSRKGQILMDRWEDLPFPKIVAIDGACVGGGCELSLASDAIVMSDSKSARIGLPEVLLGIIPGMGGCVRLPRKVGIATALDMILTGKTLNGERAFKAGLAETFIPKENFEEGALKWVAANLGALKARKRLAREPKLGGMGGVTGALLENNPVGRSVVYSQAKSGVLSKTRGHYPAPLEAIATLKATGAGFGPKILGKAREKAMIREANGFGRMAATPVSKNLIRLFFMTEVVKKSKGVTGPGAESVKPTRSVGVLGAGVMGGGIAQLVADKGLPSRMKDLSANALSLGMTAAAKIFKSQLKKRRITPREYQQKMNLIAPTTEYSGFHSVDVVIEAIIEKMDVKKKVFAELEGQVSDDCVIASNTSSLSISEMQTAMKKPERFAGMHFFNPVHRMPLVEVIRGAKSSDTAVSAVYQLSKALGKTPIVVKDAPGFLVNRLLMPYLNEATWMLADGATIPELDTAMLDFGMPMGPMELIDEVGVDVGEKVAHILNEAFGERVKPAPFNSKIVSAGRLGKKNGKGLYLWDATGRKKTLEPEIYNILGVTPKSGAVSKEEIIERCVLPMINEAARCLEEKVVETAGEVDLGMIMGTGFPPFRGGLLRYADTLGVKHVVERLRHYETRFGARYAPSPALLEREKSGANFYSDQT